MSSSLASGEGVTALVSTLNDIAFFSGLDSDSEGEDEGLACAVRPLYLCIVM